MQRSAVRAVAAEVLTSADGDAHALACGGGAGLPGCAFGGREAREAAAASTSAMSTLSSTVATPKKATKRASVSGTKPSARWPAHESAQSAPKAASAAQGPTSTTYISTSGGSASGMYLSVML